MNEDPIENGTVREIDGVRRVYYDGYWIKAYDPPADSLAEKRHLIEALTRRLFNHVEHGINVPGKRLGEARAAFEAETVPERKRVKGAMLAGALFNRGTDIFTKLVDLQAQGVDVAQDSALMRECGQCLQEALSLGKMVLHRSGEEGIDELWGEPFRAFSIPIEAFYASRYLKIAEALRCIDRIAAAMIAAFGNSALFHGVENDIATLCDAAKVKCETLRTDEAVFDIWTDFVVAGEHLSAFAPHLVNAPTPELMQLATDGRQLIVRGRELIGDIARARVAMPKSTRDYVARCEAWAERDRARLNPLIAGA
ncbi:hypothetical protein [Pseudazoarcus pumilus]|uniref:Uncharacterized protein n=1 Tax=Pseudazoarcus pumilus TaxID=2067960 RepID=A0A2I6S627_9RHOO|nr:hypothetical protein [Pseudazoarcus pumilus]AUN94705.1 hypothetical protein C0099_06985 [Pseudazoarcus pumilus]